MLRPDKIPKRQLRRTSMKCRHCNHRMLQGSIRVSPGILSEHQCAFFPDEGNQPLVSLAVPSPASRCDTCQVTELSANPELLAPQCAQCGAETLLGVVELQFSVGAGAVNTALSLVGLGGPSEWVLRFKSEIGSIDLDGRCPAFFCAGCKTCLLVAELSESHESIQCLACGREIPSGTSACPNCGWTWG
jgi:hypothetical protein